MPVWLTVLLGVLGGAGTLGGLFGISAYMQERMSRKAKKKGEKEDQEEKKEEENELKEREEFVLKVAEPLINNINANIDTNNKDIMKTLKQMNNSIDSLIKNIKLNTEATVTSLRSIMKSNLDRCKDKGYASTSEKASWNDVCAEYKALGGNHWKEYVNQWKLEMNALPNEPVTESVKEEA